MTVVEEILLKLDQHSPLRLGELTCVCQHNLCEHVLLVVELDQDLGKVLEHKGLKHDLGIVHGSFVLLLHVYELGSDLLEDVGED